MNTQTAFQLGLLVAMRTMAPTAAISDTLAARGEPPKDSTLPYRVLSDPRVAALTKLAAGGEMLFDKLPFTPSRIAFFPLLGRIGIAATLGWTLSPRDERLKTAITAGTGAAVGSFAAYFVRSSLVKRLHVPDLLIALLEDSLVTSLSVQFREQIADHS